MKNALIALLFAVALSGILCEDFPSNSVNTKNSELFTYLPSEFPKLSAFVNTLSSNKQSAAKSLEKILGYLPLADQLVLFTYMNDYTTGSTSPVFPYSSYLANSKVIIQKEKEALVEYINENAKRLPKGLGCLIKVVNTFSHDSFEDKELLKSIYTNIDNVLQAQEKVTTCQKTFLDVLFTNGLQRRQYLMENIKYNLQGDFDTPENFLISDGQNGWKDVKYPLNNGASPTPLTSPDTVASFKTFATCQHYYNNEITKNIIEAEISISQLKKCFNEKEYNPDAGKSSDKVNSSINYHKKKIIGINEGNGTRSDQRTQTNHTLNNGFSLGKKSINFEGNNKQTTFKKFILNSEWTTNINTIDKSLISTIETKTPFTNLHNLIITFGTINPSTQTKIPSSCIQDIEKGESSTNCPKDQTVVTYTFIDPPLSISSGSITYYPGQLLYSEAIINGKEYYDIYFNGKSSIGQELAETSTACISSFGSGGKNDKDACRDVMKTKCGNELDFRCKQSNLYDILNEMPISSYQIPPACLGYISTQTPDKACLNWINEKFMLGGIIPKPSQFITYGLTAQSDANYYKEDPDGYKDKYNSDSLLSRQALTSSTKLSVTETKVNDVKSIDFKNAMDATYAIMVDSSYSYSTSSFLICLLFIILF